MFKISSVAAKSAISAGIIALSGSIAWYLLGDHKPRLKQFYTDEKLVKAARELRKEYFLVYVMVSDKARKIRARLLDKGLKVEDFQDRLATMVKNDRGVQGLIEEIYGRILGRQNKMEFEKYQQSVKKRKSEVVELNEADLDVQENMERACKGVLVLGKPKIPKNLTIPIFAKILLEARSDFLKSIFRHIELLLGQGIAVGPKNKDFLNYLRKNDFQKFKIESMLEAGFGVKIDEDHPLKIFLQAVGVYERGNSSIKRLIERMDIYNKAIMQFLLSGRKVDFKSLKTMWSMLSRQNSILKNILVQGSVVRSAQELDIDGERSKFLLDEIQEAEVEESNGSQSVNASSAGRAGSLRFQGSGLHGDQNGQKSLKEKIEV